jgi:BASS family bile acid:Na+ symporter
MNKMIVALACFVVLGSGRRVQNAKEQVIDSAGEIETQSKASDSSFVQVQWTANPSPRLMPTAAASSPQVAINPAAAATPGSGPAAVNAAQASRSAAPVMSDGMAIPLPADDEGHMDSVPNMDSETRSSRAKWLGLSALSVAALPSIAKRFRFGSPKMEESTGGFAGLMSTFNNLFAIWLAIAAVAAVQVPATFLWVKSSYFTGLLGLLMFSVGITTTIADFKACFDRPGAVAINFLSCYGIMPIVAYALAKAIGADGAILAGMVLVGSINGGQASNLCTLIAGGDVALSVLMTTSTTLGCIFMTPLICKLVLGSVVPVDAVGIVISTLQVVLAPIFLGVGLNTIAPKFCAAASKYSPTIGVLATVLLVGASVAQCAAPIVGAGLPLQLACLGLHAFGGILGYLVTQLFGFDVRTCRTVAIETAMKSSAFGFVLASLHFGAFAVRVPSAVSVVWMAITGSALAVYWQGKPAKD